MIFSKLAGLLGGPDGIARVHLVVERASDGKSLRVAISPQAEGTTLHSGLSRPLVFNAMPADLDNEFPQLLEQYGATRSTLSEQIAAELTILEADTKASARRAADKLADKKAAAKPAPAPVPKAPSVANDGATGNAEDDEIEATDSVAVSQPVVEGLNLFG